MTRCDYFFTIALMQKVLTAAEMREVDRLSTEQYGIPSLTLMENAALACAAVIKEKLGGSIKERPVLIFCGKGNNGGDGAALARILAAEGAKVDVLLLGEITETKGDASINFNLLKEYMPDDEVSLEDKNLFFVECESDNDLCEFFPQREKGREYEVVVDAILGTGVARPLEGLFLEAVNIFNKFRDENSAKLAISLDLPSGLNADSAEFNGICANPSVTVTFTAPKPANVLPPACRNNGELIVADIGSPRELIDGSPSQLYLSQESDAKKWLEETGVKAGSYKKNRGHALLGVGSRNYSGAAVLCANAAVKSGAGLVTAAVPRSIQTSFSERAAPEAMSLPLPETENGAIAEEAASEFLEFSRKADVTAVGCGLSSSEESTRRFVREVTVNRVTPLLLDADGLNALAPFALEGSDELPLILTPHQGELLRLLGTEDKTVLSDRVALAREFAAKHHVILVLKGERTLIAEPGGKVAVNPTGNEGLGKGGNGDTLTGIIAGSLAQTYAALDKNISPAAKMEKTFEAVAAALYIAGVAGDIAARQFGMRTMTASNVAECLADAIKELEVNSE